VSQIVTRSQDSTSAYPKPASPQNVCSAVRTEPDKSWLTTILGNKSTDRKQFFNMSFRFFARDHRVRSAVQPFPQSLRARSPTEFNRRVAKFVCNHLLKHLNALRAGNRSAKTASPASTTGRIARSPTQIGIGTPTASASSRAFWAGAITINAEIFLWTRDLVSIVKCRAVSMAFSTVSRKRRFQLGRSRRRLSHDQSTQLTEFAHFFRDHF
jgi:hypothetical protein